MTQSIKHKESEMKLAINYIFYLYNFITLKIFYLIKNFLKYKIIYFIFITL